ncbi:MAG: SCO family protein [Deltaproteobacteria bacterium]|nr:SCO family protein [Deltaproteobacteria bacterium]
MSTDLSTGTAARAPWSVRALSALTGFLGGFRFAALVATLVLGMALLVVVVLIVPDDAGIFGAFARDFKVWCFSYDPATGDMPWAQAIMMVSELALFAAVIAFLWWEPLVRARRQTPRALFRWSAGGAIAALSSSVALMSFTSAPPAEAGVAALRIEAPAPPLSLVDHRGAPVTIEALRGKVVVVTAIYATCGYTCPMLLGQADRAWEALTPAERERVVVIAITLDPEHDTPAVLAEMARARGITSPSWHLLSGAPAEVEKTLDDWSFARRRNEETGQIDHANVFALVDKDGRQAFRLALSAEREPWLADALRLLVAEIPPEAGE